MRYRWLLPIALLALPVATSAAPGDPFGGEDDGCIPPTVDVARCEGGAAKALSNYVKAMVGCHIKAADAAVKAKVFDEELCESNAATGKGAKERYELAITKLGTKCPGQCAVASASGLRAAIEAVLEDVNGLVYACPSPSGSFGPDDSGHPPPDVATGKCEDGVAKALTKYAQAIVKCHVKAASAGVAGKPFDEDLCESDPTTGKGAKEKYAAAIAKLAVTCPACSTGGAASARDTIETQLDCHNGDVFCAGTTPSACAPACPYTCLEPFTPDLADITDAFVFRFGPLSSPLDLNVPAACDASPPVCCPGGTPVSPCGPLELSGVTIGGQYQTGLFEFDVSLTTGLKSLSDIPVNVPLVGDCGVAIDTAPGPSPTVQIDFPLHFSSDLLRMGQIASVNILNLTTDDVHLNGGFGCQVANLGLSFFLGTITEVIESELLQAGHVFEDLCRPCGSTIAQCTPATTTTTTTLPGNCPSGTCVAVGQPCATDADCCSNVCDTTNGCLAAGLGGCCQTSGDCAGGTTCSGGTCQ